MLWSCQGADFRSGFPAFVKRCANVLKWHEQAKKQGGWQVVFFHKKIQPGGYCFFTPGWRYFAFPLPLSFLESYLLPTKNIRHEANQHLWFITP
jgi:hypothetical protein